jgi:hypothetical protein
MDGIGIRSMLEQELYDAKEAKGSTGIASKRFGEASMDQGKEFIRPARFHRQARIAAQRPFNKVRIPLGTRDMEFPTHSAVAFTVPRSGSLKQAAS